MKRLPACLVFIAFATNLWAQDMPPLPPMDQPASNDGSSSLPPLPDGSTGSPQAAGSPSADNQALPPLPDASNTTPQTPAPPGSENPSAPAPPAADSQPVTEVVGAEEPKPVKKTARKLKPWERTKKRANTIFGGWVRAKGGNESSRIAWTAQEVLNALVHKKYRVVKEEGKYQGQEGAERSQWREITFDAPKSKYEVKVFMRQSGNRVWLRVGPGEPPPFSVNSVAQVQKMRETNLKALRLIQKKFGRRLSPYRTVKSWEAPYRFAYGTADR